MSLRKATGTGLTAFQDMLSTLERKSASFPRALLRCFEATGQEGIAGHLGIPLRRCGKHRSCVRQLSRRGLAFPEELNPTRVELSGEFGRGFRMIVADSP